MANYGSKMRLLLCCAVVLGFSVQCAGAVRLYVSAQGNDRWSGRLAKPNRGRTDGPLASLTGARDAIRRLKSTGPLTEPVRVAVADGTYRLG